MEALRDTSSNGEGERVLAVVDWRVDPSPVVEAMRRRAATNPTRFDLLVPASLAAIDWIGNPKASCPCATQQLERVEELAEIAGVSISSTCVGDPERVSAIRARLERHPADGVLLFEHRSHKFFRSARAAARIRRSADITVEVMEVPSRMAAKGHGLRFRRPERCVAASVYTF